MKNLSTNLNVNLVQVQLTGFDWSGESKARWYGSTPVDAHNIENQMSMTAYGIAITGSLNGISFSGAASGSANIKDSNQNSWKAGNTFDA